jgi:NAD(P)-dependent dehydrogenase (short-subunit alcohol dehydrogenase family)
MTGQFAGKTVLITGAAGNVGRAVVQKFAAEGAQLVLVDSKQEYLDSMLKEANIQNPVLSVTGDLGKPEDTDTVVKAAAAKFGTIDILAHIAGGFAAGQPVHESPLSVFEKMMYLNAQLTYVVGGRVAKHMVEKGVAGSIICVLARSALKGAKNSGAYTASKAAAQRIMESMALELRDNNIRVNGIMPSIIDTPANRKDMPNADFSKWVTTAQVADVIAFLASDAASSISGDSIEVYNKA